ncbi:MAG: hypothetical protein IJI37_03015 [Opitutales bacterium]|nr:hypothetical protein [Opitutales bacterium]
MKFGKTFFVLAAWLCASQLFAAGVFDARAFGGKGDGKTKDTAAIQAAIDAAAKAGGGVAVIDSGVWLSGTIWLRSNVSLEIRRGATLLGSPDKADYNPDDFCSQQKVLKDEKVSNAHLIIALEVENVGIFGGGTICGNGIAFWESNPANRNAKPDQRFQFPEWRPSQMLFFCECRNVKLSDLELLDPPYWSDVFLGCDGVMLSRLTIKNDHRGHNNDGIDLDACSNVVVSDCIIDTEDDCIAIRSQGEHLKNKASVCENIAISNCVLSTRRCNAFRIGVGKGAIRNCVISNVVVTDTRTGLCFLNTYKRRDGVSIENMKFSNVIIDAQNPIAMYTDNISWGRGEGNSFIRGISFSNCSFRGTRTNLIGGDLNHNISDIDFVGCEFTAVGGDLIDDNAPYTELTEWGVKAVPSAFVVANAENVRFLGCRFRWENITKKWDSAIEFVNCRNIAAPLPSETPACP